jgi:hypothetical protein
LWLLALLMALSVVYLPDFIHVSFVLPFLLIPAATLLHRARTARLWARVPGARRAMTIGVWCGVLAVLWKGVSNVAYAHDLAPERVDTAFGPIRLDRETASLFGAVRTHLVSEPDGHTLLYSYPNDAWLYLALPADDVTRFSILIPGAFPTEDVDEAARVLRAQRARMVVLWKPFSSGSIPEAIDAGYELVERVGQHRIYVRRGPPRAPGSG